MKAGFKLLKPTMDLSTNLNLWWNLWNDKYVEGFTALNKWANEYVAFPGEFFRQWVRDFYQGNKLVPGRAGLRRPAGAAATTSRVRSSSWAPRKTTSRRRRACGRSSTPSSSREKDYIELPGGHISLIAGRGAARALLAEGLGGWLATRSLTGEAA